MSLCMLVFVPQTVVFPASTHVYAQFALDVCGWMWLHHLVRILISCDTGTC